MRKMKISSFTMKIMEILQDDPPKPSSDTSKAKIVSQEPSAVCGLETRSLIRDWYIGQYLEEYDDGTMRIDHLQRQSGMVPPERDRGSMIFMT